MMLLKLAQDSARMIDHTVISLSGLGPMAQPLQEAGCEVHPLNLRRPLSGMRGVAREVRRSSPDVVQGWMYHGNVVAALATVTMVPRAVLSWSIRCSYIESGQEKWLTRVIARAGASVSKRPEAIVYNSARSRAQHAAHGYSDTNAHVIPNGFDVSRFRPDAVRRAATRARWNVHPDDLAIGLLARVHPMKDHATFLKAAAAVKRHNSNALFIVAGKGSAGLRQTMPDLIAAVEPNLRLLGEEADTPAFMNGLDIFALSSAWGEAFPNVLGEAMASAVPCVTTDVGDSAEIVADTGRVVAARAPEALAGAVLDLAAMSSDARRSLGERARARVVANYALEGVTQQYARIWRDLAQRSSGPARSAL